MRTQFLILTTLLAGALHCQAQYYQLQIDSADYQELTNPTPLVTGTWDDPDWILPVGFNFTYFGLPANTFYADDNFLGGFVAVATASDKIPLFIVNGADLIDRGFKTGQPLSPIQWQRSGPPGNQILKIEWKNAGFYSELDNDGISTDFTNFQIWFYENGHSFEIRQGPSFISQPALCYDDESGPIVGIFKFIYLDTGNFSPESYVLSGPAPSPTLEQIVDPNQFLGLEGTPPNGTIYRFTPSTSVKPEPFSVHGLQIAPNPASQFIQINAPSDGAFAQASVRISDAMGRVVVEGKVTERINIEHLSTGTYFVQASSDGKAAVEKFIKL
jgi:hypothetical protein